VTNPFNFGLLASERSQAWRRWTFLLIAAFRASQVRGAEGSQVVVTQYDRDGAVIDLTRNIPAWRQVRTGAAGLPARHATTGRWGEATVTLYRVGDDGAGHECEVLDTATETAYNRTTAVVPANTDCEVLEVGGRLFYLGHICP
jgi:hypothetical protein